MKELLGEEIDYIYMDKDKQNLLFVSRWGRYWYYFVTADCCSETWIESINNPENMIGNEVIGIEKKELPSFEDDELEYVQPFGYTFKTTNGYTDIEFRNASNGYYGGDVEFLKTDSTLEELIEKKELKLFYPLKDSE